MVNQVLPNALRVLDDSGNPEPGAQIFIYETGTTTPVTVYTDEALSVAHPSPIVADGDGYLAQIFYGGSVSLKIVIQDSTGTELQTIDPAMEIGLTGSAASLVSFSPTASISSTNVQAALEEVAAAGTADVANLATPVAATGSSGNYAISAASTISAYADGQAFLWIANHQSVGTPTLAVDGLAAITLRKYSSGVGLTNVNSTDIVEDDVVLSFYVSSGPHFLTIPFPGGVASVNRRGPVVAATVANVRDATTFVWPAANIVNEFVHGTAASEVDLTNSGANDLTEVDFTSIPANVSKVTVFFNDASFSGSDDLLVQLSTSSTFVTTGYESTSRVNSSNTSSTAGFAVIMSAQRSGIVELTRYPGTNRWMASHNAEAAVGSGHITLAGALDGVRLTRTGSNTFDGGTALISYS